MPNSFVAISRHGRGRNVSLSIYRMRRISLSRGGRVQTACSTARILRLFSARIGAICSSYSSAGSHRFRLAAGEALRRFSCGQAVPAGAHIRGPSLCNFPAIHGSCGVLLVRSYLNCCLTFSIPYYNIYRLFYTQVIS